MLTHLSLFSGIGGIDIAAEWAGFTTIGQCEFADYPYKILKKHWPDVPKWRDIRDLTGGDFYERTGHKTVDVISGGFPCQPFSVAGKQKGKGDDRYLWPEMLRVITEIKPTWVIGENVSGIIKIAGKTVCEDLERAGYTVTVFDFEAAAVGAPHRRERVFFVGYTDKQRLQGRERKELPKRTGKRAAWKSSCTGAEQWEFEPDVGRGFDGLSAILDGIGGLSDAAKNRACEILCDVRESFTPEAVQWAFGGFQGISAEEILLAFLCEYEESCFRSGTTETSGTAPEGLLRGLWRTVESARASYRREYHSQLAREYSDALLRLSHGAPSLMPQAWANGTWEDGIERVTHGIKSRVDRLKCLGNAVVPQQIYPILQAIATIEETI